MAELFDSRYFSGQGKVFIADRRSDGTPDGLEFLGDITSGEITPSNEQEKLIENVTGQSAVGSTFSKNAEAAFALVMRSTKPVHLGLATQGVVTAISGASVTTQIHAANAGKFIVLLHNKVSSVVVKGPSATPTYTVTTDYIVHADEGMIEIVSGGGISEDELIEIDYTFATQNKVSSNPTNKFQYIVFAGINRADSSKQFRTEMYKVSLDPTALGLIQEGHAEMTLSGTVVLDTLRASGDQLFSYKTED